MFQTVEDERVDRKHHVWLRHGMAQWLCVLCGGVSRQPTMDDLPERWQKLKQVERDLCPFREK